MQRRVAGPVVAAAVAALTVAVAVVLAGPAVPRPGPFPPLPPDPSPPDRVALSLDRCAAALAGAGLDGRYPPRVRWEPVARFDDGDVLATVLAGRVPFACVTGPTAVEVSDPAAAVPVAGALLLLTAPSGVVAAAAPPGRTVRLADGAPGAVALHRGADPVALEVDGTAVAVPGPAPPALRVQDRREVPVDQSAEAVTLLRRCHAVAAPDRRWFPALVLPHDAGALLLVTIATATVGGCLVTPGRAAPVTVWRVGGPTDGPRPFVWLAAPPGAPADVAAGPVQARVVRMEVTAPGGATWPVAVGGRAFATRVPAGVAPDPAGLQVRAFDADGVLLYAGPAG